MSLERHLTVLQRQRTGTPTRCSTGVGLGVAGGAKAAPGDGVQAPGHPDLLAFAI